MDEIWELEEYKRNECIQCSYVTAIASYAGFIVSNQKSVDNGVDMWLQPSVYNTVRMKYGERTDVNLHLQLKASRQWKYDNTNKFIHYDLSNKTYNDMVDCNIRADKCQYRAWAPIILVLHCVPETEKILKQNRLGTYIRKHSYWYILDKQYLDRKDNEDSTTRIHIPKSQLFSPRALKKLGIRAKNFWEEVSE